MSIKVESFEELAVMFTQQLDGSSSFSLKKEKRVSIETTDSVITNIMPCSFPNPEQVMESMQTQLANQWANDLSISESEEAFISRMMSKAYS